MAASVILLNLTTFFFSVNQDYQILTDYFSLSDRPSLSTPSIGSVRPGPCCPIALLLIFCVTASVWTSHRWCEVSLTFFRVDVKTCECLYSSGQVYPSYVRIWEQQGRSSSALKGRTAAQGELNSHRIHVLTVISIYSYLSDSLRWEQCTGMI